MLLGATTQTFLGIEGSRTDIASSGSFSSSWNNYNEAEASKDNKKERSEINGFTFTFPKHIRSNDDNICIWENPLRYSKLLYLFSVLRDTGNTSSSVSWIFIPNIVATEVY